MLSNYHAEIRMQLNNTDCYTTQTINNTDYYTRFFAILFDADVYSGEQMIDKANNLGSVN